MFWICFVIGLILGSLFGVVAYFNIEGVKGVVVGVIVTLIFGVIFGGIYLDGALRAEKWNNGYCPDCEVHWTPYGASDRTMGSKHKYYYCEECYKEIEL